MRASTSSPSSFIKLIRVARVNASTLPLPLILLLLCALPFAVILHSLRSHGHTSTSSLAQTHASPSIHTRLDMRGMLLPTPMAVMSRHGERLRPLLDYSLTDTDEQPIHPLIMPHAGRERKSYRTQGAYEAAIKRDRQKRVREWMVRKRMTEHRQDKPDLSTPPIPAVTAHTNLEPTESPQQSSLATDRPYPTTLRLTFRAPSAAEESFEPIHETMHMAVASDGEEKKGSSDINTPSKASHQPTLHQMEYGPITLYLIEDGLTYEEERTPLYIRRQHGEILTLPRPLTSYRGRFDADDVHCISSEASIGSCDKRSGGWVVLTLQPDGRFYLTVELENGDRIEATPVEYADADLHPHQDLEQVIESSFQPVLMKTRMGQDGVMAAGGHGIVMKTVRQHSAHPVHASARRRQPCFPADHTPHRVGLGIVVTTEALAVDSDGRLDDLLARLNHAIALADATMRNEMNVRLTLAQLQVQEGRDGDTIIENQTGHIPSAALWLQLTHSKSSAPAMSSFVPICLGGDKSPIADLRVHELDSISLLTHVTQHMQPTPDESTPARHQQERKPPFLDSHTRQRICAYLNKVKQSQVVAHGSATCFAPMLQTQVLHSSRKLLFFRASPPLPAPVAVAANSSDSSTSDTTSNTTLPYFWKVRDDAPCSTVCGGGRRAGIPACIRRSDMVAVDNQHCIDLRIPPPLSEACNTQPCSQYAFHAKNDWSECSVQCGPGEQRREVECVDQAAHNATVDASLCLKQANVSPDDYATVRRCSIPVSVCFGVSEEEAELNDFAQGRCQSDGTCQCREGYGGSNCSITPNLSDVTTNMDASKPLDYGQELVFSWKGSESLSRVSILIVDRSLLPNSSVADASSLWLASPQYLATRIPNTGSFRWRIGDNFQPTVVSSNSNNSSQYQFIVWHSPRIFAASDASFVLPDPCAQRSCGEHGSCKVGRSPDSTVSATDAIPSHCECRDGFSGATCELGPCQTSQPCSTNNTACPMNQKDRCVCAQHWTGAQCQTCGLQCENGAKPREDCSSCDCSTGEPGFFGPRCACPFYALTLQLQMPLIPDQNSSDLAIAALSSALRDDLVAAAADSSLSQNQSATSQQKIEVDVLSIQHGGPCAPAEDGFCRRVPLQAQIRFSRPCVEEIETSQIRMMASSAREDVTTSNSSAVTLLFASYVSFLSSFSDLSSALYRGVITSNLDRSTPMIAAADPSGNSPNGLPLPVTPVDPFRLDPGPVTPSGVPDPDDESGSSSNSEWWHVMPLSGWIVLLCGIVVLIAAFVAAYCIARRRKREEDWRRVMRGMEQSEEGRRDSPPSSPIPPPPPGPVPNRHPAELSSSDVPVYSPHSMQPSPSAVHSKLADSPYPATAAGQFSYMPAHSKSLSISATGRRVSHHGHPARAHMDPEETVTTPTPPPPPPPPSQAPMIGASLGTSASASASAGVSVGSGTVTSWSAESVGQASTPIVEEERCSMSEQKENDETRIDQINWRNNQTRIKH